MRISRFTEEQTVTIRQEHEEGASIAEVCRHHGVSEQTVSRGKQQDGGMARSDVHRLNAVAAGNARLKRLVAEQAPANQMRKDLPAKNSYRLQYAGTRRSISKTSTTSRHGRSAGRWDASADAARPS